jgi:hypothetical protein
VGTKEISPRVNSRVCDLLIALDPHETNRPRGHARELVGQPSAILDYLEHKRNAFKHEKVRDAQYSPSNIVLSRLFD